MHLQEIQLIKSTAGLPYKTYELALGLANLCIRNPGLLRVEEHKQKPVLEELERWRTEGLHRGLFSQLANPSHSDRGRSWVR